MRKKTAEITVILGKRGSGKSTLARDLLRAAPERVIIVDTLGEHGKGRTIVRSVAELFAAIKRRAFNVAVQFENAEEGFTWACRVAYAAGGLTLFIDEIDFYIKANYAPEPFSMLVRYGRHKSVEMICIARRPPDLWRNLTANADGIYCFRTIEPRDLKYLGEFIPGAAVSLPALKPFHYVCYYNGEIAGGKVEKG